MWLFNVPPGGLHVRQRSLMVDSDVLDGGAANRWKIWLFVPTWDMGVVGVVRVIWVVGAIGVIRAWYANFTSTGPGTPLGGLSRSSVAPSPYWDMWVVGVVWVIWVVGAIGVIRHSVRMSLGFCPAEPWNWKWPNGVENSEISIIWCISITNNVKICKKFNESAETAKFSVFTRGRQELCAENPKKQGRQEKLKRE